MNEEDFKKKLTPEQFHVLREKGTEAPYSGKYWKTAEPGTYVCAACGAHLFSGADKFESTEPGLAGWPSFSKPHHEGDLEFALDNSMFTNRTEVLCAKCSSHLGHVFDAGDSKSGKHYCINSLALDFVPEGKKNE